MRRLLSTVLLGAIKQVIHRQYLTRCSLCHYQGINQTDLGDGEGLGGRNALIKAKESVQKEDFSLLKENELGKRKPKVRCQGSKQIT